jgi:Transposase domain (DUF772)
MYTLPCILSNPNRSSMIAMSLYACVTFFGCRLIVSATTKETLKNPAAGLAWGRVCGSGGTKGRGDAAAGQFFAGGVCRQEKADAAEQVFGRDGRGGAVGAAGGAAAALVSEGERGRPPIGLERMLRIYFLQQWYGLADEALDDALYDSQALRGFAGIELNRDPVPDATTLLNFRHWLERHNLTQALFDEIAAMLEERGVLMRCRLPTP